VLADGVQPRRGPADRLIPFIGDLFDFVSTSNRRNLELFRGTPSSRRGHDLAPIFFVGLAAGLMLLIVGTVWLAVTLIGWLVSIVTGA
jgi:hypothetical protein